MQKKFIKNKISYIDKTKEKIEKLIFVDILKNAESLDTSGFGAFFLKKIHILKLVGYMIWLTNHPSERTIVRQIFKSDAMIAMIVNISHK